MGDNYTKRDAERLRTKVAGIVGKSTELSIDLCWACHETYEAMVTVGKDLVYVWQLWGYDSWQECVGVELGLHPTTAYNYRKVWQTFYVDLAGAWDDEQKLPITKMRILCAAELTRRNVRSWLRRAAKITCAQLVGEVYDTDAMHNLSVPVTREGLDTFNKTVEEARKTFGNGELSRGDVLMRIIDEWRMTNRKIERGPKGKLQLVS